MTCDDPKQTRIDYEVGQIWSYRNRPGEDGSHVYIAIIDDADGDRPIFHIFIDGLKVKNPRSDTGYSKKISHAPVDKASLDASLTELLGRTDEIPDISDGYEIWREALNSGKAGVFDISVAEVIECIEDALVRINRVQ